jgi:hypothetical protein
MPANNRTNQPGKNGDSCLHRHNLQVGSSQGECRQESVHSVLHIRCVHLFVLLLNTFHCADSQRPMVISDAIQISMYVTQKNSSSAIMGGGPYLLFL